MGDVTRIFESLCPRLHGIAYRILGSVNEAELVLQEARLRWHEAAPKTPENAEAWLIATITRLCLTRLPELTREGQKYGAAHLPEALEADSSCAPEQMQQRADDLTVAFLALLEQLPPEARTAFVLREMFDVDYDEIAKLVRKSASVCRQMVRRAKAQLRDKRPRYPPPRDIHFRQLSSFAEALAGGDFAALKAMLSDSVELTGDGSGKVLSFGKSIQGGAQIAQLFIAAGLRFGSALSIELAMIHGQWGLLFFIDGAMESTQSYQFDGERIARIHVKRNPPDPAHLATTVRNC
jgi:RNA polymerase sigma factor (sigma-70 family)